MHPVLGSPPHSLMSEKQFAKFLAVQPGKESFNFQEAAVFCDSTEESIIDAWRKSKVKAKRFGQRHIILRGELLRYQSDQAESPTIAMTNEQLRDLLAVQADKESFNLQEAALVSGLKVRTLQAAIQRGELKAGKFGKRYAITRSALRRYLES